MTVRQSALLVCLLAWCHSLVLAAEPLQPVKLFILAGQSNMEGQAVVDLNETHDFVRPAEESPNPGRGRHEFGDALGKGMIKLLSPAPEADAEPAKPMS